MSSPRSATGLQTEKQQKQKVGLLRKLQPSKRHEIGTTSKKKAAFEQKRFYRISCSPQIAYGIPSMALLTICHSRSRDCIPGGHDKKISPENKGKTHLLPRAID